MKQEAGRYGVWRRAGALLMALVLVATLAPVTAFAETVTAGTTLSFQFDSDLLTKITDQWSNNLIYMKIYICTDSGGYYTLEPKQEGTYAWSVESAEGHIQQGDIFSISGAVDSEKTTLTLTVGSDVPSDAKVYGFYVATNDGNLLNAKTYNKDGVSTSCPFDNSTYSVSISYYDENRIYEDCVSIEKVEENSSTEKYTVTYDANGGRGEMTDVNSPYDANAEVTVLSNGFTREGYTFSGWNTAANGSGATYAAGGTFSISANTTLYAQWTENSSQGSTTAYTFSVYCYSADKSAVYPQGYMSNSAPEAWTTDADKITNITFDSFGSDGWSTASKNYTFNVAGSFDTFHLYTDAQYSCAFGESDRTFYFVPGKGLYQTKAEAGAAIVTPEPEKTTYTFSVYCYSADKSSVSPQGYMSDSGTNAWTAGADKITNITFDSFGSDGWSTASKSYAFNVAGSFDTFHLYTDKQYSCAFGESNRTFYFVPGKGLYQTKAQANTAIGTPEPEKTAYTFSVYCYSADKSAVYPQGYMSNSGTNAWTADADKITNITFDSFGSDGWSTASKSYAFNVAGSFDTFHLYTDAQYSCTFGESDRTFYFVPGKGLYQTKAEAGAAIVTPETEKTTYSFTVHCYGSDYSLSGWMARVKDGEEDDWVNNGNLENKAIDTVSGSSGWYGVAVSADLPRDDLNRFSFQITGAEDGTSCTYNLDFGSDKTGKEIWVIPGDPTSYSTSDAASAKTSTPRYVYKVNYPDKSGKKWSVKNACLIDSSGNKIAPSMVLQPTFADPSSRTTYGAARSAATYSEAVLTWRASGTFTGVSFDVVEEPVSAGAAGATKTTSYTTSSATPTSSGGTAPSLYVLPDVPVVYSTESAASSIPLTTKSYTVHYKGTAGTNYRVNAYLTNSTDSSRVYFGSTEIDMTTDSSGWATAALSWDLAQNYPYMYLHVGPQSNLWDDSNTVIYESAGGSNIWIVPGEKVWYAYKSQTEAETAARNAANAGTTFVSQFVRYPFTVHYYGENGCLGGWLAYVKDGVEVGWSDGSATKKFSDYDGTWSAAEFTVTGYGDYFNRLAFQIGDKTLWEGRTYTYDFPAPEGGECWVVPGSSIAFPTRAAAEKALVNVGKQYSFTVHSRGAGCKLGGWLARVENGKEVDWSDKADSINVDFTDYDGAWSTATFQRDVVRPFNRLSFQIGNDPWSAVRQDYDFTGDGGEIWTIPNDPTIYRTKEAAEEALAWKNATYQFTVHCAGKDYRLAGSMLRTGDGAQDLNAIGTTFRQYQDGWATARLPFKNDGNFDRLLLQIGRDAEELKAAQTYTYDCSQSHSGEIWLIPGDPTIYTSQLAADAAITGSKVQPYQFSIHYKSDQGFVGAWMSRVDGGKEVAWTENADSIVAPFGGYSAQWSTVVLSWELMDRFNRLSFQIGKTREDVWNGGKYDFDFTGNVGEIYIVPGDPEIYTTYP